MLSHILTKHWHVLQWILSAASWITANWKSLLLASLVLYERKKVSCGFPQIASGQKLTALNEPLVLFLIAVSFSHEAHWNDHQHLEQSVNFINSCIFRHFAQAKVSLGDRPADFLLGVLGLI
jgi:hypothetical protein